MPAAFGVACIDVDNRDKNHIVDLSSERKAICLHLEEAGFHPTWGNSKTDGNYHVWFALLGKNGFTKKQWGFNRRCNLELYSDRVNLVIHRESDAWALLEAVDSDPGTWEDLEPVLARTGFNQATKATNGVARGLSATAAEKQIAAFKKTFPEHRKNSRSRLLARCPNHAVCGSQDDALFCNTDRNSKHFGKIVCNQDLQSGWAHKCDRVVARTLGINGWLNHGGETKQTKKTVSKDGEVQDALCLQDQSALAQELAATHGGKIIWDSVPRGFFVWHKDGWARHDMWPLRALTNIVHENTEPGEKARIAACKIAHLKGATEHAKTLPSIDGRPHGGDEQIWDVDLWKCGLPGRMILDVDPEKKTGIVRDARPSDMATNCLAVAPTPGVTHTFDGFLEDVTCGDKEVNRLLMLWAASCLVGSNKHELCLFLLGPGKNGKSVFQDFLFRLFGSYAFAAKEDLLVQTKYSSHSEHVAQLEGKRLVTASELPQSATWHEERFKRLVSGNPVRANFMRQNSRQFTPQTKILITANDMPTGLNSASMARRFRIVPFDFVPKKPDRDLPEKIWDEAPAVLWELIHVWLPQLLTLDAMPRPSACRKTLAEQIEAQDWIGQFRRAYVDSLLAKAKANAGRTRGRENDTWTLTHATVYKEYVAWCNDVGCPHKERVKHTVLRRELERDGRITLDKVRNRWAWIVPVIKDEFTF